MIEKKILDYLTAELDVSCYMEVPKTAPSSFVVIEKTGSNHKNRIFTATVAIQSYASSMAQAAQLNTEVIAAMMDIPTASNDVSKCSLESDYNFTDATTKRYRYQAVFDLVHY